MINLGFTNTSCNVMKSKADYILNLVKKNVYLGKYLNPSKSNYAETSFVDDSGELSKMLTLPIAGRSHILSLLQ